MKPEIANHLIRGFIFDKDIGTISRDYRWMNTYVYHKAQY
jgi:hypothetical protein